MISMTTETERPPLPVRPTPHERDGRQGGESPARPHSGVDAGLRLFVLYRRHAARLVRAVRARLGRYDWDLAESITAETWLRAAGEGAVPPADDAAAFAWLAARARQEQIVQTRARRVAVPVRAYRLPEWPQAGVSLRELLDVAA